MARLSLAFLGRMQVSLDASPVPGLTSERVRALLAYLAVEAASPHSRDALAALLWPNQPNTTARHNLRQALATLRQALADQAADPPFLIATRDEIQFNLASDHDLDLRAFADALASTRQHAHRALESCRYCAQQMALAASHYHGPFLDQFYLRDSAPFEEWASLHRERLQRQALRALLHLADYHLRQGAYADARGYAQRQLELEPYREEAHRQLMRALALGGERSAALAQYERCRAVLAGELHVAPSPETTQLYESLRGLAPLAADLLGLEAVPGLFPEPPAPACPYRGLFAFREQDAPFFFGRESFVSRLSEAVRAQPLVTVLGASGAGKSSVVFAGLLPQLSQAGTSSSAPPQAGGWLIADLRPGHRPFEALSSALLPLLENHATETDHLVAVRSLADALANGTLRLGDVAERILTKQSGPGRLLLVVDQFEELYTLCPEPDVRRRFCEVIGDAVAPAASSTLTRVLVLRADFTAQALTTRPFADVLQDTVLILGPMTRDELVCAIENPAHKQLVTFESGLVERILDDVGDGPGQLPLLEFALTTLWERQVAGKLTHAAYDAIGQVEGALARYAEEVYAGLSPSDQSRSRAFFVQLVRPGEGTEDTRRLATRAELGEQRWDLAQRVATTRLVVTSRDPAGQETAEVAHESLIQHWERLRGWIEADRGFRAWQERLRAALRQWEESGQDEGALLRGAPLLEAEGWLDERRADLSQAEQALVDLSLKLRERESQDRQAQQGRELEAARRLAQSEAQRAGEQARAARQLRWRALLLASALVVASLLALVAFSAGQQARRNAESAHAAGTVAAAQRDEAQHQARLALARQLAAQAVSTVGRQLDLALLLSLEAYRLDPGDETRSSMVVALQHQPRLITFLPGHQAGVESVSFAANGSATLLATAGNDSTILLWDLSDPQAPMRVGPPLLGHQGVIVTVAFSPDGRLLASGGFDRAIRLWDVSDPGAPQPLGLPLSGHSETVWSLAFSPDGKLLASGSRDATIRFWDVSNPAAAASVGAPLAGAWQGSAVVSFSPNGKRLAAGTADGFVRLWDVADPSTPVQLGAALAAHAGSVRGLAFRPDGQVLATAGFDRLARLWDLADPASPVQLGAPLSGHADVLTSVAFSPNGQTLASSSADKTIRLWDLANPAAPIPIGSPLAGHSGWVVGVAFSPDGKTLASAGYDDTTILWDLAKPPSSLRLAQVLPAQAPAVFGVDLSPNGALLAAAGQDNAVRLWDVSQPGAARPLGSPLARHTAPVWGVAFSPDGRLLASASADKTVSLWAVETLQPVGQPLASHSDQVNAVAFSPDGTKLATASDDHTVIVWDVSNAEAPRRLGQPLEHPSYVLSVDFSPDGRALASAGGEGALMLWDVSSPAQPVPAGQPLAGHTGLVNAARFSPDGRLLASTGEDNKLILWDVSDLSAPRRLSEVLVDRRGASQSLAFSPNSQVLAAGNADGTIRLWDVSDPAAPQARAHLTGAESIVWSLAYGPDGTTLAAGIVDGSLLLWDVDEDDWRALACRIANRSLTLEEWSQYLGAEPYRKTCSALP